MEMTFFCFAGHRSTPHPENHKFMIWDFWNPQEPLLAILDSSYLKIRVVDYKSYVGRGDHCDSTFVFLICKIYLPVRLLWHRIDTFIVKHMESLIIELVFTRNTTFHFICVPNVCCKKMI